MDNVDHCLTVGQCKEAGLFTLIGNIVKECVSSDECRGYLYEDDDVKQCLKNCDDKPGYYMDLSRACVLAVTCTERTSGAQYLYQDDSGHNRACVDAANCKDYGYLYNDNNEKKCLTPT